MSDKKLEDIENEITQLFKKALDSPFFGHDERFPLNELNNIIEKSKLKNMISTYDVFNHYDYFRSQNEVKRVPLEDVNQYVKAHLLTPKEYYFYFPIYNLADYPDKYRIGYCHVKQFKLLPSHIQEAFESTWIQDYQTNPGHFPELDQFLNHRRRTLIIQTPMIQANTSLKAAEKAKELSHMSGLS